jgi:hypothetical protein
MLCENPDLGGSTEDELGVWLLRLTKKKQKKKYHFFLHWTLQSLLFCV